MENPSKLLNKIKKKYKNIHGIILGDNDNILLEKYFEGSDYVTCESKYIKFDINSFDSSKHVKFNRNSLHDIRSVTKSIISLLIGISIDKGFIESIDNKIKKYFPDHKSLFNTKFKKQINIKSLLTMTSGLAWEQSGDNMKNKDDELEMMKSKDTLKYILSKNCIISPNKKFNYNSGNAVLLGRIIEIASDINLDKFLNKYLFKPLGINHYQWYCGKDNIYWSHAGLRMRPIDMTKIGQLLLNDGMYKTNGIIEKEWIDKLQKPSQLNEEYSLLWELINFRIKGKIFKSYYAAGNGGQRIFIIPEKNLVVVFTAGNYYSQNQSNPNRILANDILPLMA